MAGGQNLRDTMSKPLPEGKNPGPASLVLNPAFHAQQHAGVRVQPQPKERPHELLRVSGTQ